MADNRKQDLTPLIMWCVLFGGIIAVSLVRLIRLFGAGPDLPVLGDLVFIGLYLLWMVVELRVSRRDVRAEGKTTFDAMTCQLYGFGQAFTVLAALWFPSLWKGDALLRFLGIGIFVAGVWYRLWAIRTLGRFYSHKVRKTTDHRIVDSGPYRLIRHPAYTGMIVANAGLLTYFFNWPTLVGFLFVLVPAILLRIRVEEKMLFGIDGYTAFAKTRKRLFPAVW